MYWLHWLNKWELVKYKIREFMWNHGKERKSAVVRGGFWRAEVGNINSCTIKDSMTKNKILFRTHTKKSEGIKDLIHSPLPCRWLSYRVFQALLQEGVYRRDFGKRIGWRGGQRSGYWLYWLTLEWMALFSHHIQRSILLLSFTVVLFSV